MTTFTTRVATTKQLRAIMKEADKLDYNRQIEPSAPLAADGIHVLAPIMTHDHAAMERVETHMRCFALLAIEGRPVEGQTDWDVIVDVPLNLLGRLKIAR